MLLSKFDILFVAWKAIKGQAIVDYLADYPSEQRELMDSEFPDEDVMAADEGNHCHNPIFTPGIFSGVDTQNEIARTKLA